MFYEAKRKHDRLFTSKVSMEYSEILELLYRLKGRFKHGNYMRNYKLQ